MADEAVIAEAGRRLARAAGESAQVLLFGSHARGEARPDSDLDFLVIEPTVEHRGKEAVRLRRELRGLGIAADIVVLSTDHVAEWDESRARCWTMHSLRGFEPLTFGASCARRASLRALARLLAVRVGVGWPRSVRD
jgi:uncharacterized protein